MNRMADGVLKELDHIQKKEDEMIARYEFEREMKLRKDEDKKQQKKRQEQEEMIATLKDQQDQKANREAMAKADMNQQAQMWQKEREIWE